MAIEKILNTRIQLKYDSFANWSSKNPALKAGEVAIAYLTTTEVMSPSETDTQHPILFKVGPGNFNDLPWVSALAADVHSWAKKSEADFKAWVKGLIEDLDMIINVDSEMSLDSDNPVQNKIITAELNNINESIANLETYVTPQMYGAVGDGENDDTLAIQTAINSSDVIYIPDGNYVISDSLIVENPHYFYNDNGYNGKTIIGSASTKFIINTNLPLFIIRGCHNLIENLNLSFKSTLFGSYTSPMFVLQALDENEVRLCCNNIFRNIRCESIVNVSDKDKYDGIGFYLVSDGANAIYENRFESCIAADLYKGLVIECNSTVGINSNYYHIDLWNCNYLMEGNPNGSIFTGCYQAGFKLPTEENVCINLTGSDNIFQTFAYDIGTFNNDTIATPFLNLNNTYNNTFFQMADPDSVRGNINTNNIKFTAIQGYVPNRSYTQRGSGALSLGEAYTISPVDNSLRNSAIERIELVTENAEYEYADSSLYPERDENNIPTNVSALAGAITKRDIEFKTGSNSETKFKFRFQMPNTCILDTLYLHLVGNRRVLPKAVRVRVYENEYGSNSYIENELDLSVYPACPATFCIPMPISYEIFYSYVELEVIYETTTSVNVAFGYISAIIYNYLYGPLLDDSINAYALESDVNNKIDESNTIQRTYVDEEVSELRTYVDNQLDSNALKGSVSGEDIYISDISANEHVLTTTIELKNFINPSDLLISENWTQEGYYVSGYGNFEISGLTPNKRYTLSVSKNEWFAMANSDFYVTIDNTIGTFSGEPFCHGVHANYGRELDNTIIANADGKVYIQFYEPTTERLATFFEKFTEPNLHVADMTSVSISTYNSNETITGTYNPDEQGIVSGIVSLYPAMRLCSDTNGAIIVCSYNKDINAVISELEDGKLNASELPTAINTALAQAKASGEFDGADGKSAYSYAQEAGYTGTEAEFAEKLADDTPAINSEAVNELIDTKLHSVTIYGAKGDGITDDTAAIQSALNTGRNVYIPGGVYKLSGELVIKDNSQLELAQDAVLEFTQTSGNCIVLLMLSSLKGNHATVRVPYEFSGNVIYVSTSRTTNVLNTPPFSRWDPQWKSGRYLTDLNIVKPDHRGFHYSVDGTCSGTAVYVSAEASTDSTFIWGLDFSGVRIAGAFSYGLRAINFDDGWNHEMKFSGFIDACEIGVSLENCSNALISAVIQPRAAMTDDEEHIVYAKHGIQLVNSWNIDLTDSRIWDWDSQHTLYAKNNMYQHIALIGDCHGLIVNDFLYYEDEFDIRDSYYTDTPSNLESMIILQEPITRWFKPVDNKPYFDDGTINHELITKEEYNSLFDTVMIPQFTDVLATSIDENGNIFNDVGYIRGAIIDGGTGQLQEQPDFVSTGYISWEYGSKLYIQGLHYDDTFAENLMGMISFVLYDSSFQRVTHTNLSALTLNDDGSYSNWLLKLIPANTENNYITLELVENYSNAVYLRTSFYRKDVDSNLAMAIDEEFTYSSAGVLSDNISVMVDNIIGLSEKFEEHSNFVAQPEAPEDTNVLWIDTDDNNAASGGNVDQEQITAAINEALAQAKESGEFDGEDGYTPVRGEDYWTPDDIADIESYIATELAKRGQLQPEYANSIEECTDTTKLYVLPDGMIYAYMSVTETGSGYTNLAKNFEESRVNSSGALVATAGACACADYIGPLNNGDVIRIKGFGALGDYNTAWYAKNDGSISYSSFKIATISTSDHLSYAYDSQTGIVTVTRNSDNNNYSYARFSGILTGTTDDVIITINEEINESVVTTQKWTSTGHAFVPADYEDRIVSIEGDVKDIKEDILSLQNKVDTMGGSSSGVVAIPSYWESMVAGKTATVKALQTAGGKNCVSFVHVSDTHIPDNEGGRTTDIGKVMAKMLDNCEIPFAVLNGDINTRASCSTEAGLIDAQNQMPIHLAPLWGTDRLLMALGNHDGCWGDSSGYYRKQFTPERMWQVFFRGQALDFRRVFSDDGLYFYVDNVAQKTRFIVLNSNFGGEYAEDDNGWAVNNRFGTSCYGQAQLDWLADVALDMPDGYDAIIFAHVPPNVNYTVDKAQFIGIVDAYNNKTSYSGSYAGVDGWTSNNVSVDFTSAKGEIIAMFTGHVHGDSIDTATMTCPILTILSAGASANEAYKDNAPTRTFGTDTETSFDVVTINKTTRTIHCTRVGAGSDREVSY